MKSSQTSLSVSVQEQVLVDLARWLARAQQYTAAHPSCALLATETHDALGRALAEASPVEYVISKDDVSMNGASATHPNVRTRIAPFFHARGARLVRFVAGISKAELATLVDLLLPPPNKIADAGGLARVARERGISRAQIEELSGALSDAERKEHQQREELKEFFADALEAVVAARPHDVDPDQLAALLARPEVAAGILEETSRGGLAEGAAALVRLVDRHGRQSLGEAIPPALRALSPDAKERLLLGIPSLTPDLRPALTFAFQAFTEEQLARFAFPAVRANAGDPSPALYALSLVVPRDHDRLGLVRRVAALLFDAPDDDAHRVLTELARPTPEFHSFRAEREALGEAARRALAIRAPWEAASAVVRETAAATAAPEYGRVLADLVAASIGAPGFDDLCARLPAAAVTLEEEGSFEATLGLLRSLATVRGAAEMPASAAAEEILRTISVARLLPALDAAVVNDRAQEELTPLARRVAQENPDATCTHLEETENRRMRLMLLDALPSAAAALLPFVRARLKSPKWYVVRNFALLAARVGGMPRDLMPVARHPDERVRAEVLRALRVMPADEVTLDIVIGYLSDPSLDVRPGARAMFRGEGIIVSEAAVPRLLRIARDEKQEDEMRRTALDVLGKGTVDAAAEALFRFMQPDGLLESGAVTTMREVAAAALRRCPSEAGKRLFAEGLTSSVRRIRRACERAEQGLR